MDAIGQLAGGIAHDFNNMLSGIMGAADLLGRRLQKDSANLQLVNVIIEATERATSLTRKLLNFSRKGKNEPLPLDIHNAISATVAILEHSIDRKIRIALDFQAAQPLIRGDIALLQNALLNLGLNARDAMPAGGQLRIATENVRLEAETAREWGYEVTTGDFVRIAVGDTGAGIAPEHRKRLFEPFFHH